MTRTPRRRPGPVRARRRALLTACLGVGVLLSACSGQDAAEPEDAASSTAPATLTPSAAPDADPLAAEKKAVVKDYRRYWDARVEAYARGTSKGTSLRTYATGKAWAAIEGELEKLVDRGLTTTGEPMIDPKVTAIDMDRAVPRATITGCVDVSGWTLVDRDTKKEVTLPSERLTRYVSTATAEKWGKRWVVLEDAPRDRRC
ncbi:hypothetical protein [Streptomyces megasporus]|uniref:hypothetical protein n=1 Tax=Streptomyces megasporus TaxID=44060 RepID=UPI0012FEAD2A|nr:hypothetical protein [Streptomyces megasporus]